MNLLGRELQILSFDDKYFRIVEIVVFTLLTSQFNVFFEGMTEAEYASKSNMTQSGISRRRKKTLSKLKKLLNIMGSIG